MSDNSFSGPYSNLSKKLQTQHFHKESSKNNLIRISLYLWPQIYFNTLFNIWVGWHSEITRNTWRFEDPWLESQWCTRPGIGMQLHYKASGNTQVKLKQRNNYLMRESLAPRQWPKDGPGVVK